MSSTDRNIWISTFGLYNEGLLIGKWFDLDADDVPTHAEDFIAAMSPKLDKIRPDVIGEEVWCFDAEGFPVNEEMSPEAAVKFHEAIGFQVERSCHSEEAIYAKLRLNGGYLPEMTNEMDDPYFMDGYEGYWDSFRDYADQLADEMLDCHQFATDDMLRNYFDYEMFARDLEHDHSIEEDDGGVHVFSG